MVNWPEAVAYLKSCPDSKAKEQLLRLAMGKCRVKATKPKIRLPRGQKAKAKLTPLPKLKKELDRVFSIFIRRRDSNDAGIGYCITCGRSGHWTDMDCGHFQSRALYATRWNPQNCALQCKTCNAFRGGEQVKFAAAIDLKYGEKTAARLAELSRVPFKLKRDWLQGKIALYSASGSERGEGQSPEPSPSSPPVTPRLPISHPERTPPPCP